ncbi:MAG: VWA domain-containing protein [bacterium]
MWVQFSYPWFLLFGAGLPLIWYICARGHAVLSPLRKKIALVVRLVILSLLILSLAGTKIRLPTRSESVFFLVDDSDSITAANKEFARDYVQSSLQSLRRGDQAGIIVFGKEALIESLPQRQLRLSYFHSKVSPHQTDIEKSLRLAVANFPPGGHKRIVLLSDGNETSGKAGFLTDFLRKHGIQVDVLPLASRTKAEALLERIIIPDKVKTGEKFKIKTIVKSFQKSSGILKLYCNDQLLAEEKVNLKEGQNVFVFWQNLDQQGFYTYRANLDIWADTIPANNEVSGYTVVQGKPKILLLTDQMRTILNFPGLLRELGFQPELRSTFNAPSSLGELRDYDAIILDDVSVVQLSHYQLNLLASYVRDLGGGLLAIGGTNSFSLGDYQGTALEETLPVYAGAREKLILPALSLVLVIDKSGSMGERGGDAPISSSSKLLLAKKAALAVADLLTGYERLGVLSFDTVPRWTVPLQVVTDKTEIARRLSSLAAGGGTSLFPALKETFDKLRKERSIVKHIIILSDGLSAPGEFESMVKRMTNTKVSVSTVAIGEDADLELMKNIARWGKGKSYYTTNIQSLPRIFTTEALRVGRGLTVNESFIPTVNKESPILSGINWSNVPPLEGYVVTTAKDLSHVHLRSPRQDPLLVTWRYGLGRAAAFTCDLNGTWSKNWQEWSGYGSTLTNLINWILPRTKGILFPLVKVRDGKGHLLVDAINEEGKFVNFLSLQARVVKPRGENETVLLNHIAPGRYEASFSADEVGSYMVNIFDKNRSCGSQIAGAVVSYSPEYRKFTLNEYLLTRLVNQTGGRFLQPTEDLFSRRKITFSDPQEIWPLLVFLSVLLLLADIGVRTVSSRVWRLLINQVGSILKVSAQVIFGFKGESLGSYTQLIKERRKVQRQKEASKMSKPRSEKDESYWKLIHYLAQRRREKNHH